MMMMIMMIMMMMMMMMTMMMTMIHSSTVWEVSDRNLSSSRSHTACADDLSHSVSTKFLELNNVLCHCNYSKAAKNEESHEIQTKRVQTRSKVFNSKTSWLALIKHVQMK